MLNFPVFEFKSNKQFFLVNLIILLINDFITLKSSVQFEIRGKMHQQNYI